MNKRTLQVYDADAAGYAKEWREQAAPNDLYDSLSMPVEKRAKVDRETDQYRQSAQRFE